MPSRYIHQNRVPSKPVPKASVPSGRCLLSRWALSKAGSASSIKVGAIEILASGEVWDPESARY